MGSYLGVALIMIASFLPALLLRARGEHVTVWVALAVATTALHVLSFTNAFAGPLPGAEWDARTFHREAVRLAETGAWPPISMGTQFYEYILTAVYRLFGSHLLVGQSLSVLAAAWTLWMINAVASSAGLSDDRIRAGIVLVAGLYPTFLYHGALTFREPFQFLGLAVGLYFVLRTFQEFRWRTAGGAIAGFVFMGLFHHVLLGICVLLTCLFFLLLYIPKLGSARSFVSVASLVLLTAGVGYLAITNVPITLENNYVKDIRQEQGIVRAIVKYRESIESADPRTAFGTSFDSDSVTGIAASAAVNYWHYLSRPFISDLERPADGVPFVGAVARIALLLGFLVLALGKNLFNRELAFCLGAYLVVTGVWSLGTTNYGQAFRHHAVTDWLLVLMAGCALYLALNTRTAGEPLERSR